MSDAPIDIAAALYPDNPSINDRKPEPRSSPTSGPAAALYGNGDKVARPDAQGGSPLGGQAQATLLADPPPRPGDRPDIAAAATQAPFNPDRLDLPEGTVNTAALGEFTDIAKASGIKQGAAQQLVELHDRAAHEAHSHLVDGWASDAKRTFGSALPGVVSTIKSELLRDADPEFVRWIDWSGLGSHPVVLRQFHSWAQQLARSRRY